MEALLMTVGLIIVMVAALVLLGRTWPRSSRRTGFRVSRQDGSDPAAPESQRPAPEDDEVHWRWRDGSR